MIKRKRIVLRILLLVAVGLFIASKAVNKNNRDRMLRAVNLENTALTQIDYTYFCDFLQYVDGYEIMAFSADESQWNPPDNWKKMDTLKSVDGLASELGIALNTNAILDLSLGGSSYSSYCFVDNRAALPFIEQDYYVAFCDDTYSNSIVIFIYRGHHLYGI